MTPKYTTIIDGIGRNILGVEVERTSTTLTLQNPVMINVSSQNNQFQVQLLPLFLLEFIEPKADGSRNFTFTFGLNAVAVANVTIDPRITTQYDRVVQTLNPAAPRGEPPVIKLFEEES